jgi:hypothetical protein
MERAIAGYHLLMLLTVVDNKLNGKEKHIKIFTLVDKKKII